MQQLNPTLADGLWSWRQRLNEAVMVLSTLGPEETLCAARELARDLAGHDRTVVLTGAGARAPLFWHVPAGKELDTVRPDLVLLLVQNKFSPSARLLLATANSVILITAVESEHEEESARLMETIVRQSPASKIEVAVVADSQEAARETGQRLAGIATPSLSGRTAWRRLVARKVRQAVVKEEGTVTLTNTRSVPLSEVETRAKEWEDSFRRAERLLQEAKEALRRQVEQSAAAIRSARPVPAENQPRAL